MIVSRAAIEELTRRLNMLSKTGKAVIRPLLEGIEYTSIADLRNQVIGIMDAVCSASADYSAAFTAEMYDAIRAEAVDGDDYSALTVSNRDPDETEGAVRAFVGEVDKNNDYGRFVNLLLDRLDREIKVASGECVMENARRDPAKPRFARIPTGLETCPFCIMLASRGFVYVSAETAGANDHYHPNCDCRVVPGFDGMEVEGYDPDGLYERWKQCEDTVGGSKEARRLWNEKTEEQRLKYKGETDKERFDRFKLDRALNEVRTRDPEWLSSGKKPKITFETQELRDEILKKRPEEVRTAIRLRKHGINPGFIVDEKRVIKKATGLEQTIGLPDFVNGVEIKTLQVASAESTIDRYLRRTAHKQGVRSVIFDNYENVNMSDSDLISFIKGNKRFNGRIYVLTQSEKLIRVK